MRMSAKTILYFLLLSSLVFVSSECAEAQVGVQHSLELQRMTWDHSTLSVLLVPPGNVSWWSPLYLNATLRAISQWNSAVVSFALNYSDYGYLASVGLSSTVGYERVSGFDVYVSWAETLPNVTDEIGVADVLYELPSRIIINGSIELASKTMQGYVLNEVDMQNIALHELGHVLGLGHCDYAEDIMYSKYAPRPGKQVEALSTLDLFGVSTVFEWMGSSFRVPSSPRQSSVTLPSSIAYEYLPVSYEDLPPTPTPVPSSSPTLSTLVQNLINDFVSFVLGPEFLILVIIVGLALLVVALVLARQQTKSVQGQPSPSVNPQSDS